MWILKKQLLTHLYMHRTSTLHGNIVGKQCMLLKWKSEWIHFIFNEFQSQFWDFLVFYYEFFILVGLSWCFSGKEMACQCRRHRFNPLVRNISEEGNINPLQCSCLGNPMDRRSLADYNSWGPQRVGHNLATKQ